MSDDALVEFRRFVFVHEAELAASALESAGIDCAVRERYLAGAQPELSDALGGVSLVVRASDVETARQILDDQKPFALEAKGAAARDIANADDETSDDTDEDDEAECAECGAPLRNALDTCKACDALPDRKHTTGRRSRWALVKLKLALVALTLIIIAIPIVWGRVERLLTGVPEKTMSYALYGGAVIVLAVLLIKGLSSLSDRRI